MGSKVPRIAITPGEPAGIGPDLVVQLAQKEFPIELIVIADPHLLQERAKQLRLPLTILNFNPHSIPQQNIKSHLVVLPEPIVIPVTCGKPDVENSSYVIKTLQTAVEGCLQKNFDAVVTGPVHKGVINAAGIPFSGHTEFFAQKSGSARAVMMLQSDSLRVVLATTHLPLRKVADVITEKMLAETLQILDKGLRDFYGIKNPRILVCGLNPHAGEDGYLGYEEIEIIIPCLEKLRLTGMQLIGPLPADTAFIPSHLEKCDAVLTMYHDQGLPLLKHLSFETAVNVTFGLPFIRTSVDHGTALDLAGTGKASAHSFIAAINLAADLALNKMHSVS